MINLLILLKITSIEKAQSPYLVCNDRNTFLLRKNVKKHHTWSYQNVCDALTFLLGSIFFELVPSCIDK